MDRLDFVFRETVVPLDLRLADLEMAASGALGIPPGNISQIKFAPLNPARYTPMRESSHENVVSRY